MTPPLFFEIQLIFYSNFNSPHLQQQCNPEEQKEGTTILPEKAF
jgi:hypothetical protein